MRSSVVVGLAVMLATTAAAGQNVQGGLPARVVGVYPTALGPVIVLGVPGNPLYLPVWVGDREAEVAEGYLRGLRAPRPLTHDLLRNVIASMGGRVVAVHVSDLRERTFIGRVDIVQGGTTRQVDARSSDAVCLGLATGAPIYVMPHVLAGGGLTRVQLAQQGVFLP